MSESTVPPSAEEAFIRALAPLADEMARVEERLRERLAGVPGQLRDPIEHTLFAGGKRVRPALLLLASAVCGYRGGRAHEIAACLEYLHTATLLHDDVIDEAELRRGRGAANTVYGNSHAVLAGDLLLGRACAMLAATRDVEIIVVFSEMMEAMAEGEVVEFAFPSASEASERQYLELIDKKTASLLSAVCEIGALLAEADSAARGRLAEYGRELGLAFQLRDDALDFEGRDDELGKSVLADVRQGKVTFPLLVTANRCSADERARIDDAIRLLRADGSSRPAEEETLVQELAGLVRRFGAVEETNRRAQGHADRATKAITSFAESPARRALRAAARFVVERQR